MTTIIEVLCETFDVINIRRTAWNTSEVIKIERTFAGNTLIMCRTSTRLTCLMT